MPCVARLWHIILFAARACVGFMEHPLFGSPRMLLAFMERHPFRNPRMFSRLWNITLTRACVGLGTKWIKRFGSQRAACVFREYYNTSLLLLSFSQLMDIDKRGILVVNYSERLVTLLREVRQLCELGHSIPSKISKVSIHHIKGVYISIYLTGLLGGWPMQSFSLWREVPALLTQPFHHDTSSKTLLTAPLGFRSSATYKV